MSKISRITGLNNISDLYNFLGMLDTALISCTLSDGIVRISIDNDTAIITMGYSGSWVRPITVTYNGTADTWSWMGKNPYHIGQIYSGDFTLANTTFSSWTASTTSARMIASAIATTAHV